MSIIKTKKLRPVIKTHGGKWYLHQWIISHFPKDYQNYNYVEPFCGGANVGLNKLPAIDGRIEVWNDLNPGTIEIYKSLKIEPELFIKKIKKINYSERVFNKAIKVSSNMFDDYIDHAVNEFTLRRMSRDGLKESFALSDRKRGGKSGDINAWDTIIDQLPLISNRLKNVLLFNKNAIDIIKSFDDQNTLLYCDPPYLKETRVSPDAYGEYEMTDEQHEELYKTIRKFKGKVIISGYLSELYKDLYSEWKCYKYKIPNHSSQQKKKPIKVECIWTNF